MRRAKYVVHPGYIKSRNDGDLHFIGYGQLVRLHRVNPAECIHADQTLGMRKEDLDQMTHLRPQYDYP